MENKRVRELMIPLNEYAAVSDEATVLDAIRALKRSHVNLSRDRHPPRAVIVIDPDDNVIGQLGHLDFLKALEPKYNLLGDLGSLSKAGASDELIGTVIDNLRFWQSDLPDVCRRARSIKVTEIMYPVTERVDENTPLAEAIHKIVMWQTMRVLVTRKGRAVGILRLADLFDEIARYIDTEEPQT